MKPLACSHYDAYRCSVCRNCYQCKHKYIETPTGWFVKCPTGKFRKALPDYTYAPKEQDADQCEVVEGSTGTDPEGTT